MPDWTPEETQALARGDARVEIDYRPRTRGVRVVPMGMRGRRMAGDAAAARRSTNVARTRDGLAESTPHPTITAAAYRRRMGWPPV